MEQLRRRRLGVGEARRAVQNEAGEELFAGSFAHDEARAAVAVPPLVRLKVELVAIERPDGLLVERLLDAGLRVLALHPNQVAAARPRFRASGGKSDRFDAFVLCELARTDHHRFRVLEPDSDQTKALRALTRAREDLVQTQGGPYQPAARRARAVLAGTDRTVQGSRQPDLARVPGALPQPAGRPLAGREAHGARSWPASTTAAARQPAELLAKLRRAPEGRAGEAEIDARRPVVLALVATLEPLVAADQASSSARSPAPCARTPTARSSARCSKTPEA